MLGKRYKDKPEELCHQSEVIKEWRTSKLVVVQDKGDEIVSTTTGPEVPDSTVKVPCQRSRKPKERESQIQESKDTVVVEEMN